MYEHYPYWRALFTELGYAVKLTAASNHTTQKAANDTIPSQSLCFPAKLAHGHIAQLAEEGVYEIWMPCIPREGVAFREADGRFAPLLTADGSAYVKPSARGAAAKAAGAQLLVSIHLNYDASAEASGFECYAAPPALATNADSVRFGELLVEAFGQLGLRIRGNTGVRYLYYDANDNKVILESTDTTPRSDPTFTVLSSCGCPAVLCEEGFISNAGDMALLAGDDGCRQAAERYYQCICAYFGLEPLP